VNDYQALKREEYRADAWEDERREEMGRDAQDARAASRAVQIDLAAQELANRTAPAWECDEGMNLSAIINEFGNRSAIFATLIGNDTTQADPMAAQQMALDAVRAAAEDEVDSRD
jgi:hypothetical protein